MTDNHRDPRNVRLTFEAALQNASPQECALFAAMVDATVKAWANSIGANIEGGITAHLV